MQGVSQREAPAPHKSEGVFFRGVPEVRRGRVESSSGQDIGNLGQIGKNQVWLDRADPRIILPPAE